MADTVMELTKLMGDNETIQRDMEEAMEMLREHFRNKYVKRIHRAVQEKHQTMAHRNPPREVQLMQAMKQFMPEDRREGMDKMAEMIMMMNTFQSIQNELSEYSRQTLDAAAVRGEDSVHEDGVYDMDQACLLNKSERQTPIIPGIIFLMALTKRI